jgi:hypothetical protein
MNPECIDKLLLARAHLITTDSSRLRIEVNSANIKLEDKNANKVPKYNLPKNDDNDDDIQDIQDNEENEDNEDINEYYDEIDDDSDCSPLDEHMKQIISSIGRSKK